MYDDVTYWFVFRSKDGMAKGIAEIEGLIPVLNADAVVANYKARGFILTEIIATPNHKFKGQISDHDLKSGNA